MLDTRINSIIYQSQVYYTNLVNSLTASKRQGKALDHKWKKADTILGYLEALGYVDRLTEDEDITNVNHILNCLISLCDLYTFPHAAPITFQAAPDILFGKVGRTGGDGRTGERGATGLATEFEEFNMSVSTVVDSFDIDDAKGARWDYWIQKSTGELRVGSVVAGWNSDGSGIVMTPGLDTGDLDGSTDGIELDIQYAGGNIQLIATITSGIWNIEGTRYFIPNNGNGTGPISDSLPNGYIYIGNSSNLAQARLASGAFTLTNTGVATLGTGVVYNANVADTAAIALSKLAVLAANRIVITTAAGLLTYGTTVTYPNLTEVSYVKGVTSAIQTQIDTKLTDIFTTQGQLLIRGATDPAVLDIGTAGQILTSNGVTASWENAAAGFSDPMSAIADIIVRNGANVTDRLATGTAGQVLTSNGVGVALSWETPDPGLTDPMTTAGDIIIRNAGNSTVRLGISTAGRMLSNNTGVPAWTETGLYGMTGGAVVYAATATTVATDERYSFNPTTKTISIVDPTDEFVTSIAPNEYTFTNTVSGDGFSLTSTGLVAYQAFSLSTYPSLGGVLTVSGDGGLTLTSAAVTTLTGASVSLTAPLTNSGSGRIALGHSVTTAGLRITPAAGNPSSLSTGDIWFNSTTDTLRVRVAGGSQTYTIALDPTTTKGDTIFRHVTGYMERVPIGTTGQVYTVSAGGIPTWSSVSGVITGLNAGRITLSASATSLTDTADFTYSGSTLTATNLTVVTGLINSALSAGKIVIAGTGGLLTTDTDLTFSGATTTATNLTVTTTLLNTALASANTRVVLSTTAGVLTNDSDLTFSGSTLTATNLTVVTTLKNTALTSGRVPFITTAGEFTDEDGFEYNSSTNTLETTNLAITSIATTGLIPYAYNTSGLLTSIATLKFVSPYLIAPNFQATSAPYTTIYGATGINSGDNMQVTVGGQLNFTITDDLVDWNGARHTDAADPVDPQDLVTKNYVDDQIGSTGTTGGWILNTPDFSGEVFVNGVDGTGFYSIVGDVVHAAGEVTIDVTTATLAPMIFTIPLAIPGDSLYGGGDTATVNGTGVVPAGTTAAGAWSITFGGSNNVTFTSAYGATSTGEVTIKFTYFYRRISA